MASVIRKYVLAAGAAALLSSQAVYAAPAVSASAIDPLVALSVLGTAQSRAAACAAGASAAAAGAAVAAVQGTPAPGCLLPLTGPTPQAVGPVEPIGAPPPPPPPGKRIGVLPILLGLLAIAVLAALLLSDGDNDGGLEPISPP